MMYCIVMETPYNILYLGEKGWVRDKSNAVSFTQEQVEAICLTLVANRPGSIIDYVEIGR